MSATEVRFDGGGKHGTHAHYARGCRELECRLAHREYERERKRAAAQRRWAMEAPNYIDQRTLRRLVNQVTRPQVTMDDLAIAAGMAPSTLSTFRMGRTLQERNALALQGALLELLPSIGGDAAKAKP